jgi:Pvc16 N-terminal domain
MLDVAGNFLVKELNTYLLARTGGTFGSALLSRIVDDAGKWAIPDDQIGISVVNVEEERALKSQVPQSVYSNGNHVVLEPEVKLNLYLLFAANFKQYDQGLRALSRVFTFFQAHPVFTPERYPGLDSRVSKLGVDLISLTFEQLNQLWAFVGAKQLPSALYRVRLLALQDEEPSAIRPPITTIGSTIEAL